MAENNIKKLTDYNHLRTRIPMYLGGTDPHTQSILEVIDGIPEVVEETWVPALYTGFREILDNASDEVVGHGHGTKIDVNYDQDKMIFSVQDDGRGIPFDYSEEYGCHLATMVLSEPRTGRNFDERKKVAGTNGIGSSATSNTSEWFKFKIIKNGKVFSQEFNEGDKDATSLVIKDPIIKDTANKASGSFIEYHPSPNVYKHMILPERFLKSRIFEFAACNPNIKVSYNGSLIKVKPKIEQTLFTGRKTIVIDIEDTESDFTSKFIVVPNFIKDGEHYHSIVNNIPAINGGSHMDAFRLSFFKNLINALERESKKRKLFPNRSDVTEGLLIYNVTKMDSPDFDSQSKTRLTNEEAGKIINKFLNDDEFYKNIIKKNKEWIDEIYQRCADRTKKKDASELNKLQKKIGKVKVASLMDATGKDRSKCILTIAEGLCLEENTEILVFEEEIISKKIKDLNVGDKVISHTGKINDVLSVDTKIDKVFSIKTSDGDLKATANHRFYVFDTIKQEFTFKKVSELNVDTDKFVKNKISEYKTFRKITKKEYGNFDISGKSYTCKIYHEDINDNTMEEFIYSTDDHKIGILNTKTGTIEMIHVKDCEVGKHIILGK